MAVSGYIWCGQAGARFGWRPGVKDGGAWAWGNPQAVKALFKPWLGSGLG